MPNFSIKDYDKHSEEVKLVTLKFYEWAMDNHINRYVCLTSVSGLLSRISTTTTKLCNKEETFSIPFRLNSYAKPSSLKIQLTMKSIAVHSIRST